MSGPNGKEKKEERREEEREKKKDERKRERESERRDALKQRDADQGAQLAGKS